MCIFDINCNNAFFIEFEMHQNCKLYNRLSNVTLEKPENLNGVVRVFNTIGYADLKLTTNSIEIG